MCKKLTQGQFFEKKRWWEEILMKEILVEGNETKKNDEVVSMNVDGIPLGGILSISRTHGETVSMIEMLHSWVCLSLMST